MTSQVSICNIALTRIKGKRINALSDQTESGRACNVLYEPTLKSALEAHPWNFAVKRATLAAAATAPGFEFDYRFVLPTDFLRLIRTIHEADGYADDTRIEAGNDTDASPGRYLLSNDSTMEIEYIAYITDPNLYSATFVDCFSQLLSAELATNIADNATIAEAMRAVYLDKLREARNTDAQQGAPRNFIGSGWLDSRV